MQRDRRYWLRLTRLMVVALVVGLVGGVAGYGLLTSALYAHALTHPGCGHSGYPQVAPKEWERRVVAFFDAALLPKE